MYAIYTVTFTISIPPMLAYIPAPWILWVMDTLQIFATNKWKLKHQENQDVMGYTWYNLLKKNKNYISKRKIGQLNFFPEPSKHVLYQIRCATFFHRQWILEKESVTIKMGCWSNYETWYMLFFVFTFLSFVYHVLVLTPPLPISSTKWCSPDPEISRFYRCIFL